MVLLRLRGEGHCSRQPHLVHPSWVVSVTGSGTDWISRSRTWEAIDAHLVALLHPSGIAARSSEVRWNLTLMVSNCARGHVICVTGWARARLEVLVAQSAWMMEEQEARQSVLRIRWELSYECRRRALTLPKPTPPCPTLRPRRRR